MLLNGRRITNYALSDESGIGVDLQAIPLAAVDRIEVLTDGASAIYGSEAIAGVVNFILRQDFRGGRIEAQPWPQARAAVAAIARRSRWKGRLSRQTGSICSRCSTIGGSSTSGTRPVVFGDQLSAGPGNRRDESASFPANIQGPDGLRQSCGAVLHGIYRLRQGGCWYDPATQVDILPQIDNVVLTRGTIALAGGAEAYVEGCGRATDAIHRCGDADQRGVLVGYPPVIIPVGSPFYPDGLGLSGDIVDRFTEPFRSGPASTGPIRKAGVPCWAGTASSPAGTSTRP